MATTDSERYVRLTLLTYEGGKWISKHVLVRELDRLPGSPDIIYFLSGKKAYLKQKRNHHELTTSQFRRLYPTDGADTNVEDWDLHLLLKIILEFFTSTLNGQDIIDLREILRIRNEVICHTKQPAVGEQEFLAIWNELVGCIYRLSTGFDRDTALKASHIIGDFRSGPLSLHDSLEKLAQLCRNDEHMEHVLAGLARIERGQNFVATRVVSIDTKLDDQRIQINDVLDIVRRIQSSLTSTETCKIDIPNLQTQLCISGDREENVKTVEDFILRTLKAAIDKADDPNDEQMIKCAMREIIEKIEEQDAVVVSAEKGSILINIKCNTLTGLQNLLTWLNDKECRGFLKNLEAALESHFQTKMNVCLALSNDTILNFTDWSVHYMSDLVDAKSEELPYKAKVNVGVKCQSTEAVSRVVEYLTHGDAANILNTLSETLSSAVGGRIRVHATLDTGKLLTDLKKVESDLPRRETSPQLTTKKAHYQPGYTDTKTSNEKNKSFTEQTLPTWDTDFSLPHAFNEKVESDLPMPETSPQLTTKKAPYQPGYTDTKTSNEENKSITEQTLPTWSTYFSLSHALTEKVESDLPMRETSPQLTTQKTPYQPGYTDTKTSNEENKSITEQTLPTLEKDVSKLSLDVNDPGVQMIRDRDRFKMPQTPLVGHSIYREYPATRQNYWEYQAEHQEYLVEQQEYLVELLKYLVRQQENLVEQHEYLSRQKKHMEYLAEQQKHQGLLVEQGRHQEYLASQQEYLMEQQKYLDYHQEYLAKQQMRHEYLTSKQKHLERHRKCLVEQWKKRMHLKYQGVIIRRFVDDQPIIIATNECLVEQQEHIKDLAGQQEYLVEYQIYLTMQQKEHRYLATQLGYRVRQQMCLAKQQKHYEYLSKQQKLYENLVGRQQMFLERQQKDIERYQKKTHEMHRRYQERLQCENLALSLEYQYLTRQNEYLREQQEFLAKQLTYNKYLANQQMQKGYLTNKQEYLAKQHEHLTDQFNYLTKKQIYHEYLINTPVHHANYQRHTDYLAIKQGKHEGYLTSNPEYMVKRQKQQGYMAKQPEYSAVQQNLEEYLTKAPEYLNVQQKQMEYLTSKPEYLVVQQKEKEYLASELEYLASKEAYMVKKQDYMTDTPKYLTVQQKREKYLASELEYVVKQREHLARELENVVKQHEHVASEFEYAVKQQQQEKNYCKIL